MSLVETKQCYDCRGVLSFDMFPLGRPRADGTRHRFRLCQDCLVIRVKSNRRDPELDRIARRESRFRRRQQRGHW